MLFRFIELLRAIAVALIANSHFKGVYPKDIFSFGAGMGMALFYMISGYLLVNVEKKNSLKNWYLGKVIRLYIPLWIYKILMVFVGYQSIYSIGEFFGNFIFPANWFVASMVVLYGVYGLFVKKIYHVHRERSVYAALILTVVSFSILYITKIPLAFFDLRSLTISAFELETYSFTMQLVWFACMLLGLLLREKGTAGGSKKSAGIQFLMAAVFFCLNVVIKLILRNPDFEILLFLTAVFNVGFAYFLFRCLMSFEEIFSKIADRPVWKFIGIVSGCSLEIFYCQFFWIGLLKKYPFPLNFLGICGAILISGYLLHMVSEMILGKSVLKKLYTIFVKLKERQFVSGEGQSLRYMFFPARRSDILLIGFQACSSKGPRYNYVRTLNKCSINRLLIKDDFGPNKCGDYYLGCNGTYSVERAVYELIDKYINKLQPKKLVFIGSSKGGYAALNFGLSYPDAKMIIAAPQYYLGTYLDDKWHVNLEDILGEKATDENKMQLDNRLKRKIKADRFGGSQTVYIHYSDQEHTYEEHIKDLLRDLSEQGIIIETDIGNYTVHEDLRHFYPVYLQKTIRMLQKS